MRRVSGQTAQQRPAVPVRGKRMRRTCRPTLESDTVTAENQDLRAWIGRSETVHDTFGPTRWWR